METDETSSRIMFSRHLEAERGKEKETNIKQSIYIYYIGAGQNPRLFGTRTTWRSTRPPAETTVTSSRDQAVAN